MPKYRALLIGVGLLSIAMYINTLAPTITWQNDGVDSGDFATAVAVGGVPHPPGYPTYLLLGEAFKLLPVGDIAYRLNLLSATCAALTVIVVGLIIHQTLSTATPEEAGEAHNFIWLCAAAGSLMLAFSGVFWSQAVIAEVYALNALFVAVLLYAGLQVRPTNERWLVPLLFGLFGLSLGNHPSILLLLPALMWIVKARWCWRLFVAALLAFCIGLCVYLVIPVRAAASPPVNWGMATNLPNFVWLVTAQLYRQFFFSLPWEYVPARVGAELQLLAVVFLWWGLPVAVLGLGRLYRLNRRLAFGSLITVVLVSIYAIGYNTTDSHVYLLPAVIMFSVWLGWGLFELGNSLQGFLKLKPRIVNRMAWGLLLLPLISLAVNLSDQDISRHDEARGYALQNLQLVAPDAVIISDNDPQTFALWYARYGLAARPDVSIVNANLLSYDWYRQSLRRTHNRLRLSDPSGQPLTTLPAFVEWNVSGSPIYLATLQLPTLDGYHLEPLAQGEHVGSSPHLQHVERLTVD